jgi:8-oxo-dGTP pyrophosphatase MutT (NUDIX family)
VTFAAFTLSRMKAQAPTPIAMPALSAKDQGFLQSGLQGACQIPPPDLQPWFLKGWAQPLGWMSKSRAQDLAARLPSELPLWQIGQAWVWQAQEVDVEVRSQILQDIAQTLRDEGQISGWRDEAYACWGCLSDPWPYQQPELFRLERAAFRHWGLRSHACHVHGLTPDGYMWCGRRALSKATDPGLLDNLAAGGLPADESPLSCAVREVAEEAGLRCQESDFLGGWQELLTERTVPEGWHSERLFIYSLALGKDVQPRNQDGEVSEFMRLSIPEVLQRIADREFTPDAACAIASTLISTQIETNRRRT